MKKRVEAGSTDYKHVSWDEESLYFVDEEGVQWHFAYPVTINTVADFKVGKVYRNEQTGRIAMCVVVDDDEVPVCLGGQWVSKKDLATWHEIVEENA